MMALDQGMLMHHLISGQECGDKESTVFGQAFYTGDRQHS